MKNLKFILIAAIGLMLFTAPAVTVVAQMLHVGTPAAGLFVLTMAAVLCILPAKSLPGVFTAGVQKEMWAQYIIDRFWKDNQFLTRAYNDDQFVLMGKIVHIPQPGALPNTQKNRSSFPAVAVQRADTDIVYVMDVYTADPTHIPDADKYELSYDKIDSIYGDHAGALTQFVADDIVISKWLDETVTPVTKLYTTGGSAGNTTAATAPAATGTRFACDHTDLKKWQLKFNSSNVPKTGRQAMFESNMLDQFTDSLSDTQYRQFNEYYDAKEGVIGRLYGFDILERSSVAVANAAHAIKALGAAGAATDCVASLVWQKDCVARAMGDVKFFEDIDAPLYYGDLYSSLMRMGGRRRRGDDLGVGAMIQGQN